MKFHRYPATAALITLGLLSQAVLTGQTPDRATPSAQAATIVGVVLNERREPVAGMRVQAFPARAVDQQAQPRQTVPPPLMTMRASGSASTDNQGRFRISGLQPGEYLLAAGSVSPLPSRGSTRAEIYAITFYPSTASALQAVPVSASVDAETSVAIELVRVRGARVSGSVVSPSGRPTDGMSVRLFHQFGSFGSGSTVAVVGANGTFEISGVPPGWYRLSVEAASPEPGDSRESVEKLIEVPDGDLDGLALVLGRGAAVSGRIVLEATVTDLLPFGLRVDAWSGPEQFSQVKQTRATVAEDWSFHMSGLSGIYRFILSADNLLSVAVARITVDGVEAPAGGGVDVVDGTHEVVLFVARRELPRPAERTLSSGALVEEFRNEKMSFRQFDIAKEIVQRHDAAVLPALTSYLNDDDRHARGNAAFVFAGLGDPRGFRVITEILADRSDRAPRDLAIAGQWTLQAQIREDRYYAAHLLGDLRDPRAVAILVPLLHDKDVGDAVPSALGKIGDRSAIGPLIDALGDPDPSIRVLAIYALTTLHATEALPRLTALVNDQATTNFGAQVSVSEAARGAIARLR